MLGNRYHGVMKLEHAARYLLDTYPADASSAGRMQAASEAYLAIQLLRALRKIVFWCDYATL